MNKCIVFVRVSTNRQEVDSQLEETVEYAKSLGFDDFKVIKRVGASAFEVSKFYREMIDELKETVLKDRSIKAVVCWHLNRLCRNDKVAVDIKEFLVKNKVNLFIKEPTIKLLNDDGTVNDGAELAFSLFATMNKQQIEELRKKVIRAKKRDMLLHKYIGGPVVRYGYRVEDSFLKPDPVQAEIVREIYDIYINSHHSYPSATREINERHGLSLGEYHVADILATTKYWDETQYPAIITEDTYRQAETIRKSHNLKDTQYRNRRFANRLIKCPLCGKGYTANVRNYRCATRGCKGTMLSIPKLDGLLWLIASHLESEHLMQLDNRDEYLEKKAVLEAKIKSVEGSATKDEKARERAKKCVVEGIITIEEYKDRIKTLDRKVEETRVKVGGWQAEIAEIDRLMNEDTGKLQRVLKISGDVSGADEQRMREIVRKWVKRISVGGGVVTIDTLGRSYRCVYKPWNKVSWYTVGGRPLAVRYINRDKYGKTWFADCVNSPEDIVATLAWLSGSLIV